MKYILDGYNVIYQIAALRGKSLRSQREGLIRLLEMAQAKNKRFKGLSVVFDGQSDINAPNIRSTLKVIFTKGKSADKKIKEMVEFSTFSRDIAVVSNDREIRACISSAGAKKVSVREFLNKVYSSITKAGYQSFKLDGIEAKRINQEMENVWLKNKGEKSERKN